MANEKVKADDLLLYTAQKLKGVLQVEKVWENPNPTSTFGAQNITDSRIGEADIIGIEARNLASSHGKNMFLISKTNNETNGAACIMSFAAASDNVSVNLYRQANFDAENNRIMFSKGYNATSGRVGDNDNACIPFRIWALKLIGGGQFIKSLLSFFERRWRYAFS